MSKSASIFPWQGRVAVVFLLAALLFNVLHFLIFRDTTYIFKFILAQLGFLPISVYLVTIVINQLLGRREKEALLNKLNMVIGSFFSEVGTSLLTRITHGNPKESSPFSFLDIQADWTEHNYRKALETLKTHEEYVHGHNINLQALHALLKEQHVFLLGLLGNANLLEHESFTELLWAVFHLSEELNSRQDLTNLTEKDLQHIEGDIKRVYSNLAAEWIAYMQHLQKEYPFLFSLAIRTNPFNPDAHAEIT